MIPHLRIAVALICGGLIALSAALIQPVTSQPATPVALPTPGVVEIENVEFDHLVSSPPFTNVPPSLSFGVTRITLAPGGVLDVNYGGPSMYLVESGEVMVSYQANTGMALIDTAAVVLERNVERRANRDRRRESEQERSRDRTRRQDRDRVRDQDRPRGGFVLGPGQAISANYGNLGRTTNVGDGPATILAIVTAPFDASAYESESFEVTAVPAPTRRPT